MNNSHTFNSLTLAEDKIILNLKTQKKREILFSELEMIYLRSNKVFSVYKLISTLFLLILAKPLVMILPYRGLLFIPALIIFITVRKYNYKSYEIKIHLNDGTIFSEKIHRELKEYNLNIVNDIKNEIFKYKINKLNNN